MANQDPRRVVERSALGALLVAWGQGKLAEHPPRLGWVDLVIVGGLAAAWALGRRHL